MKTAFEPEHFQEWMEQEAALRRRREGAPLVQDDCDAYHYDLVIQALCSPEEPMLPPNFAMELTGHILRANEASQYEDVAERRFLLIMGAVTLVLCCATGLRGVNYELLSGYLQQTFEVYSMRWIVLVALGAALHVLIQWVARDNIEYG